MSVPPYYAHPAPVTPHGRAGPPARGNGPRVHSIVAVSVIASLGSLAAFFAFFMGIFLADACHRPGDLACNSAFDMLMALGSVPAVGIAVALAAVGIGRARHGGGHGYALAAWGVWGGFCLVWWVLIGMATA